MVEIKQIEAENRRRYNEYVAAMERWNSWRSEGAIKEPIPFLGFFKPQIESEIKEPLPFLKSPLSQDSSLQEVTIQEVPKPDNTNPSEYTIPARVVQDFAQRHPAIQKPAAYISSIPIERFTYWLDIVLKRNNTCLDGHWLPVGPVCYPFTQYTSLTKSLCRQIADAIESKGYCVEPDARFGNGKYDERHTLALFKPFEGDPIQPSTAYLGAANLLRLCMHITTADGQIDQVELDVFRRAIENQIGLTRTDHKRLLILEQLLAQELASTSKIAAKIARSVPADKRLVIGKLLVEVAAANNVITNGECHALEEIFKALKISPDKLEKLINEICPWPRRAEVQSDISSGDKWIWDQWRTDHPGVVIDDNTLVGEVWNLTDWKALNARWRDLHERLIALQSQPSTISGVGSQEYIEPVHLNTKSASEGDNPTEKSISDLNEQLFDCLLQDGHNYDQAKKLIQSCKDNELEDRSPQANWAHRQIAEGRCRVCGGKCAINPRTGKYYLLCQRHLASVAESQRLLMRKRRASPSPQKDFAIDMERVYQITNETKEVVAILSVEMADEPEESISMPVSITLPAPEIPKVSSDGNAVPQPTRFNGLNAAFHPILERLLTRESWPVDDFDALAREFHFMPGKICETINEWSDEALGKFILDGDDPVVIRRELIAKETIYG